MVETYRASIPEWTADDWAAYEMLLRIDGYTIKHCTHCDRYPDGDPDKHPSCLIVPLTAPVDPLP